MTTAPQAPPSAPGTARKPGAPPAILILLALGLLATAAYLLLDHYGVLGEERIVNPGLTAAEQAEYERQQAELQRAAGEQGRNGN